MAWVKIFRWVILIKRKEGQFKWFNSHISLILKNIFEFFLYSYFVFRIRQLTTMVKSYKKLDRNKGAKIERPFMITENSKTSFLNGY